MQIKISNNFRSLHKVFLTLYINYITGYILNSVFIWQRASLSLTFLKNSEVWGILNLNPLPKPKDMYRRSSPHSAFKNNYLSFSCC